MADSIESLIRAAESTEEKTIENKKENIISYSEKDNSINNSENSPKKKEIKDNKQSIEAEKYINVSITLNAHKKLKTLSSLTGKNIRDLMTEIINERFKKTFDAELKKFSNEYL